MHQLTKFEIQKIDAIEKAMVKIRGGFEEYICLALPPGAAGKSLRAYVMKSIKGHFTYGSWLEAKGYCWSIPEERQGRLRWLEAMKKSILNNAPVKKDW